MRMREDAACVVLGAVLTVGAWAPERAERSPLTGISHVAFRVSEPAAARSFYAGLLGLPTEAAAGSRAAGLRVSVNERQYVFLRPGLAPAEDRLDHVALETTDVEAMRRYLASRGVEVPAAVARDESGNPAFTVHDPEGRAIELVQHESGRWPRAAPAPGGGPGPLSRRMMHAGILVGDLEAARHFYGDVLGLTETWRGSRSGKELSWTNMKVPDGEDYVEFMLYAELPPPDRRGTAHHVCLEVADVEQAKARLGKRARRAAYARPLESRVGTNRKRQLNLFDPDGTRVELMEPRTVDGLPVPPSDAPPPAR